MRKLLVALMMVAFAATAFAADVKFSGSYEIDGKLQKNYGAGETTNQYYEHDFDLWMNVQTDKDTFFKTKLELLDDTITGVTGNDANYDASTQFSVQRAWLGHNFGGVLVEAGLMNAGSWGYAFADDAEGAYRIKATFNVAGGKLAIFTQKKAENGSDAVKDSEKDDSDKYSIGWNGKIGNFKFMPKFDYDVNSGAAINQDFAGADNTTMDLDVAFGGKIGALSIETEAKYNKTAYDSETATRKDYDVYGLYANIGYNMGAATVGFLTAYGSTDKDMNKGFDFDDDFDSTFILGDDTLVNNLAGISGDDLVGFWANAVYVSYDASEKLNLMAKYAYATSNWDAGVLKDASVMELDLAATYAITKELTYYVNAGWASIDLDTGTDPEDAYLLKHGLVISF